MRILLLGADTPIGYSLQAFILPLQRHDLLLTPLAETHWSRPRVIKKLLKSVDPDIILDARLISQIDTLDAELGREIKCTRWLGELAGKLGYRYFLISSSRVFAGDLKRPYREMDKPDAVSQEGKLLIESERSLKELINPLCILRLGWVFSGRGSNAFNRMLNSFRDGQVMHASDNYRDCPVYTAEVARVIAGIIDQVSVGAPTRGLYHYGSDGDIGWFTFAETVAACASKFDVFCNATELLEKGRGGDVGFVNRSLDCTVIRHQFGIQCRPWQNFVECAVRDYMEVHFKGKNL